jgi:hypothetical protein
MSTNRIKLKLSHIENQIHLLSERLYNPTISNGELKELNRKKKKLIKSKCKLMKRLDGGTEE